MIKSYFGDLKILRGGTHIPSYRPIRLLGRNYWCFQYNHSGLISIEIDGGDLRHIEGPSLLITSPGHDYVFGNRHGWHHNYLAFEGSRIQRYIETDFLPVKNPILKVRDGQTFLMQLKDCIMAQRHGRMDEAVHGLEGLLLQVQREKAQGKNAPLQSSLQNLIQRIRDNPAREVDLQGEADGLHISLVHLRRLFKEMTGQAPGQYQLERRLALAADKLSGTFLPIKQIAIECGIENIHYFSRVFSRKYQLPPGKFRREFLGA